MNSKQPVDELDEILENWFAQSKEQLKARLLQWGTRQRMNEVGKINMGDVRYPEKRLAELRASLKDGENDE